MFFRWVDCSTCAPPFLLFHHWVQVRQPSTVSGTGLLPTCLGEGCKYPMSWGVKWERKARKHRCMASSCSKITKSSLVTTIVALQDTWCKLCACLHCHIFQDVFLEPLIKWFIDRSYTSGTAQGGGGSFKNRKRIGEIDCCEWRMSEQKHWPTD